MMHMSGLWVRRKMKTLILTLLVMLNLLNSKPLVSIIETELKDDASLKNEKSFMAAIQTGMLRT